MTWLHYFLMHLGAVVLVAVSPAVARWAAVQVMRTVGEEDDDDDW